MEHEALLNEVYTSLRATGTWPFVRDLQKRLGPSLNVRVIAADIGIDVIVCEQSQNPKCFLTRKGFERVGAAAGDLDTLAKALGLMATRYTEQGPVAVTGEELATALRLSDRDWECLGALMRMTNGPWNGGSSSPDEPKRFSLSLNDNAVFFDGVETYAQAQEVWDRIARDEQRIREATLLGFGRPVQETPFHSASSVLRAQRYRLAAEELDAVFESDLIELDRVHSAGAWKSAALLAGSCMEAVLLDLMLRHPDEAQKRFGGPSWMRSATADRLLRAAADLGLITTDHKDLGAALKRWRDVIHPAAAMAAPPPTRELADAIVASLRLLLADLNASLPGDSVSRPPALRADVSPK